MIKSYAIVSDPIRYYTNEKKYCSSMFSIKIRNQVDAIVRMFIRYLIELVLFVRYEIRTDLAAEDQR